MTFDFSKLTLPSRSPQGQAHGTQETTMSDQDNWDDFELPSTNEAKAASSSFELDPVPDGFYSFAITDISPQLKNNYDEKVDRRAITFTITDGDDWEDEKGNTVQAKGQRFKQFYNITTHPKGSLYPLLKAAMGGNLDPDYRPKMTDLRDAQGKGSLITKPKEKGDGMQQVLEGIMPQRKKLPVPSPVPF